MSTFDPYHDWLGIPAGARPVNHYSLLGLKLFTSEPPVIAEAADERLARLQPHLQGPQAADAQRLSAEVTAARATLISAANRRAYDATLRQQLGMPPAADGRPMATAPAVARPAAPAAQPVASPAVPAAAAIPRAVVPGAVPVAPAAVPVGQVPYAGGIPQAGIPQAGMPGYAYPAAAAPYAAPAGVPYGAQPMAAAPFGSHVAADPTSLDEVSTRRKKFRRSSSGSMAAVGVALAIIGTAGAVCFAYREQLMAALEGKQQVIVEEDPQAVAEELAQKRYEELLAKQRAEAEAKERREARSAPPQQDLSNRMATNFGSTVPTMEPTESRPKPKPKPAKPTPRPPAASVSIKPVTPEEQAAVAKSLAAARAALGERNLGKADEQLNLAMLEASSAESLNAIDRVRALQECLDQFWKAVRERVKGLKAIDEVQIDGKEMIVVDADAEHLSVRVDGQVRDYLIEKLPTNMAYALAKEWLAAGDPHSKVVLAAFQVTDPKANHDEGKQLLEQAAAEGSDMAKTLLKVLGNGA